MGKSAPEAAQRVAEQLRKVIAAVVLFNEQVAARVGMSASESQTLHLLELHGPISPSELAKLTKLSTGTMTHHNRRA
jgi:DNA-binding MarR family transcriptional regulator